MTKFVYFSNFEELSVGEPEIASALEELGHEVVRVNQVGMSLDKLERIIIKEEPDVLLSAKFKALANQNEIRLFLKELKIPFVIWNFDLYIGL